MPQQRTFLRQASEPADSDKKQHGMLVDIPCCFNWEQICKNFVVFCLRAWYSKYGTYMYRGAAQRQA